MKDLKLLAFLLFSMLFVWVSLDTVFAQDTSGEYDVLVGGIYYGHDMDVLFSFIDGYTSYDGSVYDGTITYAGFRGITSLFNHAQANGYEMIVYSYGGANYNYYIGANYPDIIMAMPAGSNSFQRVFYGDIDTCPMIITAAGADTNVTGYATEFHSIDPITPYNLSSFANGYIAGQISFIAVSRGITFQEARIIARHTSSNIILDRYSGYGLINIESALAFVPLTPNQMVQYTIDGINELIIANRLTSNHAKPLITKLENVLKKIEKNKITPAINQINAFINQVNDYVSEEILTAEDGQSLIALAEEVISELILLGKISPQLSEDLNIPTEYKLEQNYPNPFNPETTIEYIIPEEGYVTLKVYDVLGNTVATLVDEYVTNTNNKVTFDAKGLASGTYIYRLSINEVSINKKLIILK